MAETEAHLSSIQDATRAFVLPPQLTPLFHVIREQGGRALLVGGCVRDMLLGSPVKDLDVEVYDLSDETLRSILERLGRVDLVGQSFAVYKFRPRGSANLDIDVSLPRRDRKSGPGHKGFTVSHDPQLSFAEASRRRDLTINAILYDPLERELIDPWGGIEDIKRRILRAVDRHSFAEDSLRVLRVAQFAARFEFEVEPQTVEVCRAIDLTDLPRERIWGEVEKLLLRARRPSIGMKWLRELGVVDQLFPEIKALIDVPQDSEWHPEGWILTAVPSESFITSVAQPSGVERRPLSLRELMARPATTPAVIPTSNSAASAQPADPPAANLPTADNTGTDDFAQTPMTSPTILTETERLVWSFGVPAPRADEVVRVMFKISLDSMLTVVRSAVNDYEVVRGVVHPVAVFVVNVLPIFQRTPQRQLHDDAMNTGGAVFTLPTGVHVTSVIVDARATPVDNHVLFYFDLTLVRDSNFIHDGETSLLSQCFEVKIGDVFYHTQLTIDRARELTDDLPFAKQVTVMLAALCHDFGKPATTEFLEGRWRSRGHEEAGVQPTESFLDRLNIHTLDGYDVRAQVIALVRDHLKPGEFYNKRDEIGDGAFRRLARKCELELLYRVARADSLGRNAEWVPREKWFTAEAQEWFIARARELEVEQKAPAPILMGRHLLAMGLKPSPLIGEITRAVYEMQLDGRVRTLAEAQEAARRMIEK